MKKKAINVIFWVVFAFFILSFFVIFVTPILKGAFFLFPLALYSFFGLALLVMALKDKKLDKNLRKYLIITGSAAACFFLFTVLHNEINYYA